MWLRYTLPGLLDEARAAVARLLHAPLSTIVLIPNATTGINTVLRNLVWNSDGKDEIIYFSTIYGSCEKTVYYVCEANRHLVQPRRITSHYPIEDDDLLLLFKKTVDFSRSEGKRPRIAVFDTVSSLPGIRVPFAGLISICQQKNVLSIVDGAHGIGHIPLDLTDLNPDFFVSNLHKWLFVPRGCAVFYVPEKHQKLMRSSLPTSHGFVPAITIAIPNPLPSSSKSEFIINFQYTGTTDPSNYAVVPEAIKWRQEVCGGEAAIMNYNQGLAKSGGQLVAKILGTKVLDNKAATYTGCCFANILLPIPMEAHTDRAMFWKWMMDTLITEHKTFIAIVLFQDQWWARLSAQVYLDLSDFEWAGQTLKELCTRVRNEKLFGAKKVELRSTSLL